MNKNYLIKETDMKPTFLQKSDYFSMAAVLLVLLVACLIISPKEMFWNDELYSWYLLSDPSFRNMWQAFGDKINNTPPLYFILGWIWAQVFSASELSLRLFSSLGIGVAFVLIWITLRRYYAFLPVAVALISVFCTSELILQQNTEARMYGLFLATAALVFWMYDQLCRQEVLSNRLLILNFLVHAAFVNTHLHGLFFSGAILCAIVFRDILASDFRIKVYLTVVLGWLTLILYIPAFMVQSDAGRPRSWMPEPLLQDLTILLPISNTFVHLLAIVVVVIIGLIPLAFSKKERPNPSPISWKEDPRIHLILFALAVLLVPVGVWLISKVSRPIFFDRYFMPTLIGWAILLTHMNTLLFANLKHRILLPTRWPKILGPLVHKGPLVLLMVSCFVMLIRPIQKALIQKENKVIFGEDYFPKGYEDLPVVCQLAGIFPVYMAYSEHRDQYFYVLDHDAAMEEASGPFGFQEYKHMDALQRNYGNYFKDQIIESEDFLNRFQKFLVLDYRDFDKACPPKAEKGLKETATLYNLHCPQWLEKRILPNPAYKIEVLVQNRHLSYILVERVE
jgi:hypothetical protein